MSGLYPLLLEPLLVPRIWGAGRLPALHGLEARAGEGSEPIGESWLLCDENVVRNGSFAGKRVFEVVRALGEDLLGAYNVGSYGLKLALMAKLLDAADDLSIQVHPDDAYALEHEAATGHLGKAEAWYVMRGAPGARVVWGFAEDVTAQQVRDAVLRGDLERLLRSVPVAPGDVVVNPAGTVHAVGAGLLLFEIQQSSDLTYRLYDYDRRDAGGETRRLHLDKALAVADLRASDLATIAGPEAPRDAPAAPWRRLVTTPQFTLDALALQGADRRAPVGCSTDPASFDLLVCLSGALEVTPGASQGFQPVTLRLGDAALLPAALGAYELAAHTHDDGPAEGAVDRDDGLGFEVTRSRVGPGAG